MIKKLEMIFNIILICISLTLYNYKSIRILNYNYVSLVKICYLLFVFTNLISIFREIRYAYPKVNKINIVNIALKSLVIVLFTLLIVK
ncbi:hypothetical protein DP153_03920 [Clostridium tetani]|uniref:hypothetical protein n=1 Tax=Clostridium tetani TaxID=1513 RepID=UPI0005135F05|nr:hypothetical protein [Clostridium tetani]KGI36359.1 hypothetical protein KY52_14150 [Clostridium tetani]KHO30786.1 hypothetical protein OR63_13770 [Clostridium tetani]KIG19773.1 hypothetical protein RS78_13215 [Clostridium tetani]RXI60798.1 hypothetical protein DP132_08715 [Clostridium tetani]RXI61291.1 hypothetical protein DP123_13375 [Clostridium tetani]